MPANRAKPSQKKSEQPQSAFPKNNDSKSTAGKIFAGRNGGRKENVEYRPEFAERAKLLCAKGATTYDLADHFGVTPSTILEWRAFQEDFDIASEPNTKPLIDRVNEILVANAIGYDRMAENVRVIRGNPVTVRYRKHTPGYVEAQKFLLTNLKPDEWSTHPEPKPEANGNPLAKLYESICGTKFMPNEDQTPYLERQARAAEKGIPYYAYHEPEEDDADHRTGVDPINPNKD